MYPKGKIPDIENIKSKGIDRVIVDASGLADILDRPNVDTAALASFDQQAQQYRCEMTTAGLGVDAVIGSPNWAQPDQRYIPTRVMQHIAASWTTCPIGTMYFDIEPQAKSKDNHMSVRLLADTVTDLATTRANEAFPIGFFLPYWAPSEPDFTRLAGALRRGDVAAGMTYRRALSGHNGFIDTANRFVTAVNTANPALTTTVGFETGNDPEPGVSFRGHSQADVEQAATDSRSQLASKPGFDGYFINSLDSFNALKN